MNADIVARVPAPAEIQYLDDDYNYECADAVKMRAAYLRDLASVERTQAEEARKAASLQAEEGASQVVTALLEWAARKDAAARMCDRQAADQQRY